MSRLPSVLVTAMLLSGSPPVTLGDSGRVPQVRGHVEAYPVPAPAGQWMISDDTQMTLALHDALVEVSDFADIPAVTDSIVRHFIAWELDPENFRAPGMTCMGSLANLRGGAKWYDPDGAYKSAGCGAVMRLVPAAFAPEPYWRGLTALQAVITHKHPAQ